MSGREFAFACIDLFAAGSGDLALHHAARCLRARRSPLAASACSALLALVPIALPTFAPRLRTSLACGLITLLWLVSSATLKAQPAAISAEEIARPPSAERLDAIVAAAEREGWGRWVAPLRDAAFAAYAREPAAAGPWYYLYRWAQLFATPRAQAVQAWIEAVEKAGVAHRNMSERYALPPGSLAGEVPRALQRWLIGQPGFAPEFFATLSEVDHPTETLGLLARLHAAAPADFADYASLALAIAVVYDVPPPPDWPHGQVSPQLLPRRLPDPVEAFTHWVRLDRANVTAHRLRRLPAAELKFVVDASAPLADLAWARRNVTPPLFELAQAYDMIRYRTDRVEKNQFSWPGRSYALSAILQEGGICVDQAFFAANAGKARGVPTLLFRGAGLDGRHAWFGFLSNNGWVLDAGRYAEQRYVAGVAHDPQTWRNFTDHELLFLSERFRATPLYQLSALHAAFAAEFLRVGATVAGLRAAREAVNRERRHLPAWQVLLAAQEQAGEPARAREATLREAMQAFQKYPDLERAFATRLIESLRARGETSLAATEEQRLVQKYRADRIDLSIRQAGEMLQRSLATDDLAGRIRTYRTLLERHGRGAGIDFFDQVVEPFVQHLRREAQYPAARDALDRARRTLRVEQGGQLEQEIRRLGATLQVKS